MALNINDFPPEQGTVRFGDHAELEFTRLAVEIDVLGERVEEATLFFRMGQELRGLQISSPPFEAEVPGAKGLQADLIDPFTLSRVLQLPSRILLDNSEIIQDQL